MTVSRELGVEAVLTGDVTRRGERLFITAKLTDQHGAHLWRRDFDRPAADVLAVQTEVVNGITSGPGRCSQAHRASGTHRSLPMQRPIVST